jgi:starvation-inducible outer membrane lipoprotein
MNTYRFIIPAVLVSLVLICCAPVLRKDVMDLSTRDVSLADIRRDPDTYKGQIFTFGGIIVSTTITAEGSLVEALYVRVDSRGYFDKISSSDGRFLALFPQESGFLDPMIFRSKREITLAAEFIGMRIGTIDETEYPYPFFIIVDLYLWEERSAYSYPPPYYGPYPYYWGGYPYWWGHPYWRTPFPPPYW